MESVYNKKLRENGIQTVAFVLIQAIFFALSVPLFAQDYTVNTNGDTHAVSPSTSALDANGNISLRSALEAATAISGSHTITFGSIGSSIDLTLGQITVGNASAGNNITITGPGMNSLSVNQTTDNRIFSTGAGAVTFVLEDITLHFAGPGTTPYSGGGGAIIAGGASAVTTLTNVTFSDFDMQIGNGGALSQSSSLTSHNLTVTNCVFSGNKCGGAGGAISYNGLGTVLITGCTFSNNHTGTVGANTGGDGGAVSTTGGGNGGTYTIEKSTFLNNYVENSTGHGGAIINTNGALTARYNRFIGNGTANTSNPPLANVIAQTGGATVNTTNADNNWWGINTGPGTNDATALAAGGTMTVSKWLQLKHTASPASVNVSPPGSTTLTASFLSNSANEAIVVSNLTTLIGLPITFSNPQKGSLSGIQTTIQSTATATATYSVNANACPPADSIDAKVDNATARATVTIVDNIPPVIDQCQSNISNVSTSSGHCYAPVSFSIQAHDNCSFDITYAASGATSGAVTSGSNFNKGTTTVVATVTDAGNNTATCSFTITVIDNEAPVVSGCPTDQTVRTGPENTSCSKTVTWTEPTATDNCDGALTYFSRNYAPGDEFPLGTTTVTYTFKDDAGNTSECSFTVTVRDNTPPTISCPANINVGTDANQCYATVSVGTAGASDNCATTTVDGVRSDGQPLNATYPPGLTTIHWTATDGSGNTATCDQTVTVSDQQPPSITCPGTQTIDLIGGGCRGELADYTGMATTSDNCSGTIVVTQDPIPSAVFGVGSLTVTLKATDASGNTATCSFTVNKEDHEPPEITCPASVTVDVGANCTVSLADYTAQATATDGCSTPTVTQSPAAGTIEGPGSVLVTLTATDASNNTSQCTFTVTVRDNTPPTINCPSSQTVYLDANCSASLPNYSSLATTNDNCSGVVTVTQSPLPSTVVAGVGSITVTLTAKDAANNTSTCSFMVNKVDNTPPQISCPVAVNINAPAGQCYATASAVNAGTATATDKCGTANVSGVRSDGLALTANYPVGATTITWTATDGSNNTSTCTQTITVNDVTPPSFTQSLTANPTVLWPPDHTMRDVLLTYTVSDNCGCTPTVTISENEPDHGTGDDDKFPDWQIVDATHIKLRAERGDGKDARVYTITVTCTDASGNSTSSSCEVRVAHNITNPITGTPVIVGSTVNFAGVFWDKAGNKHTGSWLIDGSTSVKGSVVEPSGTKNGKVTGSYKFGTTGVYRLQMNVTDQNKVTSFVNTNEDLEEIVVIYDPNGGYTYGGGWFDSPSGALTADNTATGKVSYGFSVNYYKGATLPKGETQFEFKVGSLQYNALNFDYLSIAGYKAVFAGSGKIIGGQSGINFTMYVIDGALDGTGVDKVRIKIYNKNTGYIYYDNEPGSSDAADPKTPVGLNSTVIITGTPVLTKQRPVIQSETGNLLEVRAIPNPTNTSFNVLVTSNNFKDIIRMQVIDMYGRIIEVRNVTAGETIHLGNTYRPGTYVVKFIQGERHEVLKLMKMPN